jgi:isopenicillin-N N-acyltransferase-like protein
VHEYLPTIEAFDASFVEEMRGIAVGAAMRFRGDRAAQRAHRAAADGQRAAQRASGVPDDDPDGCTGVVVLPEPRATAADPRAELGLEGRSCAETAVVLKVRRDDGPIRAPSPRPVRSAAAAMNSVASRSPRTTSNAIATTRSWACRWRCSAARCWSRATFALATGALVYTTAKSASNNLIVSHCAGIAIDFECAPDETFLVHPAARACWCTPTHWQARLALGKPAATPASSHPQDSLYATAACKTLLAPAHGRITARHVKRRCSTAFVASVGRCAGRRGRDAVQAT